MHKSYRTFTEPSSPPVAGGGNELLGCNFPEAMSEFEKTSAKITIPSSSPYNIRTAQKREEVQERLSAARETYEGSKGSIASYIRRGIHKVGENSRPANMVLGIVKDIKYVSPVVGAVQIVLDVSCTILQSVIELTGSRVLGCQASISVPKRD
jgi:hypothetical protein